jgi:hypothetical protein
MENNSDGQRQSATVSGLKPGDFPLGSLESRAAARAMLDAREAGEAKQSELSDDDLDALVVYRESMWLTARMTPDYHDVEALPIYKRGKEVYETFFGKTIPAHLDPHFQRGTAASFAFGIAFHREPESGGILRYTDVKANYAQSIADVLLLTEVWKQRLPNLPCPLRIEGDKLFCLMKPERRGEDPIGSRTTGQPNSTGGGLSVRRSAHMRGLCLRKTIARRCPPLSLQAWWMANINAGPT